MYPHESDNRLLLVGLVVLVVLIFLFGFWFGGGFTGMTTYGL